MLKLQDVRMWPLNGCPYLLFYVERDTGIVIWRVLQMQRDLPAWMSKEQ
ncbi:type II toxin-antitoxin system RelE/ParE family toxin [Xanthomonas oryzae]